MASFRCTRVNQWIDSLYLPERMFGPNRNGSCGAINPVSLLRRGKHENFEHFAYTCLRSAVSIYGKRNDIFDQDDLLAFHQSSQ